MANVVGRYTIHGFYKTAAKFDFFSSSFAMLIGTDITIITLPETNIADELPLKMVCWKTEDQPFLFVFRLGDLLVLGRVSTIIQKKNPTIPLYAIPRRPLSVPDDWGIPNHELLALLCPKKSNHLLRMGMEPKIFTPTALLGEDKTQLDSYFSDGLKPPTRLVYQRVIHPFRAALFFRLF